MVETLRGLEAGTIQAQSQDHTRASLAPILKKEDGHADFRSSAQRIYNRLRGFQPWPGCYTILKGKKLGITSAKPHSYSGTQPAGELLVDRDQLFAICGDNSALQLLEVQPEGKRRMNAADFIRGHRSQTGEKLGA
jgi:methionyl-tRNA formyltransferase